MVQKQIDVLPITLSQINIAIKDALMDTIATTWKTLAKNVKLIVCFVQIQMDFVSVANPTITYIVENVWGTVQLFAISLVHHPGIEYVKKVVR